MKLLNISAVALLSTLMSVSVASAKVCKVESFTPTTADGELVVEQDGVIPISFTIDIPAGMISVDNARVYRPYLVNGDWKKELPTVIVEGANYKVAKSEESTFGDLKAGRATRDQYGSSYKIPLYKGVVTGVKVPYECVVDAEFEARGALLIVESSTISVRRFQSNWINRKEVDPKMRVDTLNSSNPYHKLRTTFENTFGDGELMDLDPKMYLYPIEKVADLKIEFGEGSMFVKGGCAVDPSVFNAPFKKLASDVAAIVAQKGVTINEVVVEIASSPEGAYARNKSLAECRTATVKALIKKNIPAFTDEVTTYNTINESWDAFADVFKKRRDIESGRILRMMNDYSDLDVREKALLNSEYGAEVLDVFESLRLCNITVHYTETISVNRSSKGQGMSLVSAKKSGDVEYGMIAGAVKASESIESLNNAMVAATLKGDYDRAFDYYKRLQKFDLNSFVYNNVGVLLTYVGDYPMAEYYYTKASELQCAKSNMGVMNILKGDYDSAMAIYGDCNCKNAIALKFMYGRYDEVIDQSKCAEYKNADLLYIRALAYSQKHNNDLTLFTLEQACKANKSFKVRAKSQAEFADLYDCDKFKAIVK